MEKSFNWQVFVVQRLHPIEAGENFLDVWKNALA